jgi:CheY-like chemotaxis protein
MEGQAKPRILIVDDDAVMLRVNFRVDGFEILRRLKEMLAMQGVPCIFLSARAQDEDRTRGYALGVEENVTKPFDPSHLVEIIRRALAHKTAQA